MGANWPGALHAPIVNMPCQAPWPRVARAERLKPPLRTCPLSLIKVVEYMRKDGHAEAVIQDLVFNTAMKFYSASAHWTPNFNIVPVDPATYQR